MRIDSSQTAQPLPESGRGGNLSPAGAETRAATSSALGEDSAQFSGTGVQIQALVAQTLQFPEIREERVNALRQLVAAGRYRTSPKPVAEAVLGDMQAVGPGQRVGLREADGADPPYRRLRETLVSAALGMC